MGRGDSTASGVCAAGFAGRQFVGHPPRNPALRGQALEVADQQHPEIAVEILKALPRGRRPSRPSHRGGRSPHSNPSWVSGAPPLRRMAVEQRVVVPSPAVAVPRPESIVPVKDTVCASSP